MWVSVRTHTYSPICTYTYTCTHTQRHILKMRKLEQIETDCLQSFLKVTELVIDGIKIQIQSHSGVHALNQYFMLN